MMPNTTIAKFFYNLPSKQPEQGLFEPINMLSMEIKNTVEQQLIKTDNQAICDCAAYIAFEYGLLEFLNNSSDAHATIIEIYIILQNEKEEINILFRDKKSETSIVGIEINDADDYDWKNAIKTPSNKKINSDNTSGGQHLALATLAFFLENHHGSLLVQNNEYGGFDVWLNSTRDVQNNITPKAYEFSGLILNCVESMLIGLLMGEGCGILFENLGQSHCSDLKINKELEMAERLAEKILEEIKNPAPAVKNAISTVNLIIKKIITKLNHIPMLEDPTQAIADFKKRKSKRSAIFSQPKKDIEDGTKHPLRTSSEKTPCGIC